MKLKYKAVKVNGKWNVIDEADGFVASFAVKWEAEDFVAEMNERDERV